MATSLAVTNPIPSLLTNAKVYREGADQLGVATVEMPNFEFMNETVTGFGIAGEVEMPVVGHFGSMAITLQWNTTTRDAISLLEARAHHLDIRGSIQKYDAGTGEFVHEPVKVVCRGIPKTSGIGNFEPGTKMEPETEMELTYLKMWIGGQEAVEIDKFNFIFMVNGVDQLAAVRSNLGV